MKSGSTSFARRWKALWVIAHWAALIGIAMTHSCAPNKKEPEASGIRFAGINRLETLPEGKWKIVWQPIVEVTDVRYLVYQTDSSSAGLSPSEPLASTKEHFLITPDLRFSNSKCFVVTALVGNEQLKSEEKQLCTEHEAFQFKGISQISALGSDGYVLNWESAGFARGELLFEIWKREASSSRKVLVNTTYDNFYLVKSTESEPLDSSKNYCFQVNYVHKLSKDSNTAEVCTDSAIEFSGLEAAEFKKPDIGVLTWRLAPSEVPKVSSFRVYRVQGRARRTLLAEIPVDPSSGQTSFRYEIVGVALESRFPVNVRAVSKNLGLEDANDKVIDISNPNIPPRLRVLNTTAKGCDTLARIEQEQKDPYALLGQREALRLESLCKVNIAVATGTDAEGITVPKSVSCRIEFTDLNDSQSVMRPQFEFRARLPGLERPIVSRKKVILGEVVLDPVARIGSATATYEFNPAVDKRGSDIFCEAKVSDTLADSTLVTSNMIFLPDVQPTATGLFVSKRRKFINADLGNSHYYPDPDGGAGAAGHTCLVSSSFGFVPNLKSLDICEDTSVEVMIKPLQNTPAMVTLSAGQSLEGYMKSLNQDNLDFGNDYLAFYADPANRMKVGYFDPDPTDRAILIEIRDIYNGIVTNSGCLEGTCTVSFQPKQDFNSGHPYADRDKSGAIVTHGQFEYRVRTSIPDNEDGVDAVGRPLSESGWSNWAKVKIDFTAVDEEPAATGLTVTAIEDEVQRIVICEDGNETDPDCSANKLLVKSTSSDSFELFQAGNARGYRDAEADPVVRVTPKEALSSEKAAWVKPKAGVANPDPKVASDWETIAISRTTDPTTDQVADYAPFKCFKESRKCVGYLRPAPNANRLTMGDLIRIPFDLWVEVDTTTNKDPSYLTKSSAERTRKSATPGMLKVDFEPVNDSPQLSSILEASWKEDEGAGFEIILQSGTPLNLQNVAADKATFYDPDGDERIRDFSDIEVRTNQGYASLRTSYCVNNAETNRLPADMPAEKIGNTCSTKIGEVEYQAVPNMAGFMTLTPMFELPQKAKATLKLDWSCFPQSGCRSKLIAPQNYFGTVSFEFRARTSKLNDFGEKLYRAGDWSEWTKAEITIQPVPDKPIVTTVTIGERDSNLNKIMEDTPFVIRIARGDGIGSASKLATDLKPDGTAYGVNQRIFSAYFDVDTSDDVATKLIITAIPKFQGVPVIVKPDGTPITVPDDSIFSCDAYGICTGTVKPGPNLNSDALATSEFSFAVVTQPKSGTFTSDAILRSDSGVFSMKIEPVDDSPLTTVGGSGSTGGSGASGSATNTEVESAPAAQPLYEDKPAFVYIRSSKNPDSALTTYTDPDTFDLAEWIEITDIQYTDPAPTPDLGNGYGWPSPPPAPISRTAPFDTLQIFGYNRNENSKTSFVLTTAANVSDNLIPADAQNPSRLRFSCRSVLDVGPMPAPGDCILSITPPPISTREKTRNASHHSSGECSLVQRNGPPTGAPMTFQTEAGRAGKS